MIFSRGNQLPLSFKKASAHPVGPGTRRMAKHSFPRIFFYILWRLVNDFFMPLVKISKNSHLPNPFLMACGSVSSCKTREETHFGSGGVKTTRSKAALNN